MQGKVIEFWRAVEMFSPPAIPVARPSQRVFDVAPDQPLPWNAGHPLRRQRLTKDQTWRHIVYVGTYPLEKVFEDRKLSLGNIDLLQVDTVFWALLKSEEH